jgi:hypothetical protein
VTTKLEIITDALGEIGLGRYVFDTSPERLQTALHRLDGMAAEWDGKGIRVGYNLGGDINSDSGIPDTNRECFVLNLAVRIGPGFGKNVSVDTKVAAKNAWSALYVSMGRQPVQARPPHLPVGAGNRAGVLGPQYFPETTEVEGLNDGAEEY